MSAHSNPVREEDEHTPLNPQETHSKRLMRAIPDRHINRVLPLALAAALAMAATSATTVYAYADIICVDPGQCTKNEQHRYAGSVALAVVIANICGILAVGPLQASMKSNPKAGLLFWLTSRAASVAVLALAVAVKSIGIAFVGRVFEGLATDNLLHYNLSAIYVSASDGTRFPRLMGTSLALYMIGMSLSPTIAGLFPNFVTSFTMALAIFGASLLYLALAVPTVKTIRSTVDSMAARSTGREGSRSLLRHITMHRPLLAFYHDPVILLPGVALLLYNTAQAYLFPALMVFTALRFTFTGKQNGYLISIAAATSALYLFVVFYVWPRLRPQPRSKPDVADEMDAQDRQEETCAKAADAEHNPSADLSRAVVSMGAQLCILPCIYFATAGWQIYPLVALLSLGLASPSFMKSLCVGLAADKSAAVAGMAMMESIGSVLSAVVLGAWQSWQGEASVFFAAAALVAAALMTILTSAFVVRERLRGR